MVVSSSQIFQVLLIFYFQEFHQIFSGELWYVFLATVFEIRMIRQRKLFSLQRNIVNIFSCILNNSKYTLDNMTFYTTKEKLLLYLSIIIFLGKESCFSQSRNYSWFRSRKFELRSFPLSGKVCKPYFHDEEVQSKFLCRTLKLQIYISQFLYYEEEFTYAKLDR